MAKPVYTVKFSDDDGEWVATCDRYPSLSFLDFSPESALAGLTLMIAEQFEVNNG